jgi:hypothetical protein
VSMSRLGRVAGLVVVVSALAGCGNLNPGVAVKAGDETVTVREVDDTTGDYCEAILTQLQTNKQVVPNRYLRSGIAGVLAQRSVAEQLATEYDVEPGERHDEKVVQVEQSVSSLDPSVQDAVVTVETAGTYIESVEAAVGEKLLTAEGTTGAKYSDQVARGRQAYEEWISEHGVSFNPQFGVAMVKGNVEPADTAVSLPVGDNAKAGASQEPDQAYAESLPGAHSCG